MYDMGLNFPGDICKQYEVWKVNESPTTFYDVLYIYVKNMTHLECILTGIDPG